MLVTLGLVTLVLVTLSKPGRTRAGHTRPGHTRPSQSMPGYLGSVSIGGWECIRPCFLSSCSGCPPASSHRWNTSRMLLSRSPLSSVGPLHSDGVTGKKTCRTHTIYRCCYVIFNSSFILLLSSLGCKSLVAEKTLQKTEIQQSI